MYALDANVMILLLFYQATLIRDFAAKHWSPRYNFLKFALSFLNTLLCLKDPLLFCDGRSRERAKRGISKLPSQYIYKSFDFGSVR